MTCAGRGLCCPGCACRAGQRWAARLAEPSLVRGSVGGCRQNSRSCGARRDRLTEQRLVRSLLEGLSTKLALMRSRVGLADRTAARAEPGVCQLGSVVYVQPFYLRLSRTLASGCARFGKTLRSCSARTGVLSANLAQLRMSGSFIRAQGNSITRAQGNSIRRAPGDEYRPPSALRRHTMGRCATHAHVTGTVPLVGETKRRRGAPVISLEQRWPTKIRKTRR